VRTVLRVLALVVVLALSMGADGGCGAQGQQPKPQAADPAPNKTEQRRTVTLIVEKEAERIVHITWTAQPVSSGSKPHFPRVWQVEYLMPVGSQVTLDVEQVVVGEYLIGKIMVDGRQEAFKEVNGAQRLYLELGID
jgi:hypothetical protein